MREAVFSALESADTAFGLATFAFDFLLMRDLVGLSGEEVLEAS